MADPVIVVKRKLFEDLFALAVKHDFEAAAVLEVNSFLHGDEPNPARVEIFIDNTAGSIQSVVAQSGVASQVVVHEVRADRLYEAPRENTSLFRCPGSYEGAQLRHINAHEARPSDEIIAAMAQFERPF